VQHDYPRARAALGANLALCRALGHQLGVAEALSLLASIAQRERRLDEAQVLAVEALAIYRAANDRLGIGKTVFRLGQNLLERGDAAGAREHVEESLVIARELGEPGALTNVHNMLGELGRYRGDYQSALASHEAGLKLSLVQLATLPDWLG
jgi:tetratricopeptide (TPR) repeat protein